MPLRQVSMTLSIPRPREGVAAQGKSIAIAGKSLRHAGIDQIITFRTQVMEADADKACLWAIYLETPGNTASFVEKGSAHIPGASCRILVRVAVQEQVCGSDLNRHAVDHRSGLECTPKVSEQKVLRCFLS